MVASSCTLFLLFCIQLPTQKHPLIHNSTSSKAQTPSDPPPVNIIQIFRTCNSTQLGGKPAKDWGAGGNRKKPSILQDWTHGSWILVHVNSEATLGSQTLPSKAQSVKPADFCTFLIPFLLHWCTENLCRTMTNLVRKLFQICCFNQDHSNPDFGNTNLDRHFQKLQIFAILQSFPYEEGTELEPWPLLSCGPNQYSPSLQKHMHKIWWRMRPASYCYLVGTCINSFSDSAVFAKSLWLATLWHRRFQWISPGGHPSQEI